MTQLIVCLIRAWGKNITLMCNITDTEIECLIKLVHHYGQPNLKLVSHMASFPPNLFFKTKVTCNITLSLTQPDTYFLYGQLTVIWPTKPESSWPYGQLPPKVILNSVLRLYEIGFCDTISYTLAHPLCGHYCCRPNKCVWWIKQTAAWSVMQWVV